MRERRKTTVFGFLALLEDVRTDNTPGLRQRRQEWSARKNNYKRPSMLKWSVFAEYRRANHIMKIMKSTKMFE